MSFDNRADLPNRVSGQIGTDPVAALEQRRDATKAVAALRMELAPLRAVFRGGTASPYDQERKSLVAEIVEKLRVEFAESEEKKVSEARLDSAAHSHADYREWLRDRRAQQVQMEQLEAKLNAAEAEVAYWDRLMDLANRLMIWGAAEMRMQ